jgi:predicted TPR repeat methyltransferase
VLALDATHAVAWFHRGMACNLLRQHQEALASFDRLLEVQPDMGEAWMRHGQTLQCLGRHDAALASYDKALSIDPGLGEAWSQRGGILKDGKRLDEAAASFEKALAHGADPELNRYFLASVAGRDAPGTAPQRYVRFLFDDYADSYDQHLVDVLKYQAHRLLTQNLQGMRKGRFGAALDLGCGTGLCGPLVKTMAERVDGVDLSPRMIEKAAALGVYEHLAQAELCDHLQATAQRYDLVLPARRVHHVSGLEPVFAGVSRVLAARRRVLLFSRARRRRAASRLKRSRYTHSERYVREAGRAARHGGREHRGGPIREPAPAIEGLSVYLSRP